MQPKIIIYLQEGVIQSITTNTEIKIFYVEKEEQVQPGRPDQVVSEEALVQMLRTHNENVGILPTDALCVVDGAAGIYVPMRFAERYIDQIEAWEKETGRSVLEILLNPQHEEYWEAWSDVRDTIQIVIGDQLYDLYEEGDLFALPAEKRPLKKESTEVYEAMVQHIGRIEREMTPPDIIQTYDQPPTNIKS